MASEQHWYRDVSGAAPLGEEKTEAPVEAGAPGVSSEPPEEDWLTSAECIKTYGEQAAKLRELRGACGHWEVATRRYDTLKKSLDERKIPGSADNADPHQALTLEQFAQSKTAWATEIERLRNSLERAFCDPIGMGKIMFILQKLPADQDIHFRNVLDKLYKKIETFWRDRSALINQINASLNLSEKQKDAWRKSLPNDYLPAMLADDKMKLEEFVQKKIEFEQWLKDLEKNGQLSDAQARDYMDRVSHVFTTDKIEGSMLGSFRLERGLRKEVDETLRLNVRFRKQKTELNEKVERLIKNGVMPEEARAHYLACIDSASGLDALSVVANSMQYEETAARKKAEFIELVNNLSAENALDKKQHADLLTEIEASIGILDEKQRGDLPTLIALIRKEEARAYHRAHMYGHAHTPFVLDGVFLIPLLSILEKNIGDQVTPEAMAKAQEKLKLSQEQVNKLTSLLRTRIHDLKRDNLFSETEKSETLEIIQTIGDSNQLLKEKLQALFTLQNCIVKKERKERDVDAEIDKAISNLRHAATHKSQKEMRDPIAALKELALKIPRAKAEIQRLLAKDQDKSIQDYIVAFMRSMGVGRGDNFSDSSLHSLQELWNEASKQACLLAFLDLITALPNLLEIQAFYLQQIRLYPHEMAAYLSELESALEKTAANIIAAKNIPQPPEPPKPATRFLDTCSSFWRSFRKLPESVAVVPFEAAAAPAPDESKEDAPPLDFLGAAAHAFESIAALPKWDMRQIKALVSKLSAMAKISPDLAEMPERESLRINTLLFNLMASESGEKRLAGGLLHRQMQSIAASEFAIPYVNQLISAAEQQPDTAEFIALRNVLGMLQAKIGLAAKETSMQQQAEGLAMRC